MSGFSFNLGDAVIISASGESGEVIARAEYKGGQPGYLVRYMNGNGCAVEVWWNQDALQK